MSLLSKAEIEYLEGKKKVPKSYEYKLKSIIKRKISNLFKKELPLLGPLFPNLDLTKFSKNQESIVTANRLTDFSKNTISKVSRINHLDEANSTPTDKDKLYNCPAFIQLNRVRSVVRISRRSSEPQTVGSKPIGPVNHTGSNNSLCISKSKLKQFVTV